MSGIYDKYPEFVDLDPRISRPNGLGYRISADMMELRHSCFLEPELVKNKRILDLGSCISYTGAWALHHGASFYRGVEYDDDFANIAREQLGKYFPADKWTIDNMSIEDFFKHNTDRFDIVVASGIIYSFVDPVPFLNNISSCADTCIIESVHPWSRSFKVQKPGLPNDVMQRFRESPHWEPFIENEPFTTLGERRMVLGPNNKSIEYIGCHVSMGYLKRYMDIIGFRYDSSVNENLKLKVPKIYNKWQRFATRFIRNTSEMKSNGFIQSVTHLPENAVIKDWDNYEEE